MNFEIHALVGGHFAVCDVSFITVLCVYQGWGRADSGHAKFVVGCASISSHLSVFIMDFSKTFNNLKPYAMNQIAEQVIRVIWMLPLATFFIIIGH